MDWMIDRDTVQRRADAVLLILLRPSCMPVRIFPFSIFLCLPYFTSSFANEITISLNNATSIATDLPTVFDSMACKREEQDRYSGGIDIAAVAVRAVVDHYI
jgi:hypothetical protein